MRAKKSLVPIKVEKEKKKDETCFSPSSMKMQLLETFSTKVMLPGNRKLLLGQEFEICDFIGLATKTRKNNFT